MVHSLSARLQTLFVLIGLVILFGIASPHFLTTDNLLNVMQQSAINAILGIGLTFVIISAGIDLSVGSILALCGLVVADLLVAGQTSFVAIGAGMLVGLGCANIAPALFSLAGHQTRMPGALAITAVSTLSFAGILAGPALIGFAANHFGLIAAFIGVATALLLVAMSTRWLRV